MYGNASEYPRLSDQLLIETARAAARAGDAEQLTAIQAEIDHRARIYAKKANGMRVMIAATSRDLELRNQADLFQAVTP